MEVEYYIELCYHAYIFTLNTFCVSVIKVIILVTDYVSEFTLDISGTSHFWSRSRWEKKFRPGPFRNKFWCRSQSKKILVPVPVKNKFWSRSRDHFVGQSLPISNLHPTNNSISNIRVFCNVIWIWLNMGMFMDYFSEEFSSKWRIRRNNLYEICIIIINKLRVQLIIFKIIINVNFL